MPDLPATSTMSAMVYAARRMLANSATFRTWTGTASEAAALARIHEIQAPAGAAMPFGLVMPEQGNLKAIRAAEGAYAKTGAVYIQIEQTISEGAIIDAFRDFCNNAYAIFDELLVLSDTDHPTEAGYRFPLIVDLETEDGPGQTDLTIRNEVLNEFMVRWRLTWGPYG